MLLFHWPDESDLNDRFNVFPSSAIINQDKPGVSDFIYFPDELRHSLFPVDFSIFIHYNKLKWKECDIK